MASYLLQTRPKVSFSSSIWRCIHCIKMVFAPQSSWKLWCRPWESWYFWRQCWREFNCSSDSKALQILRCQDQTQDPGFNISCCSEFWYGFTITSRKFNYLFLPRSLLVRLRSEYFTTGRSLKKAMLSNQHIPLVSSHQFKFVNWGSLLPKKFKKGHIYKNPTHDSSELAKKYPGFLDMRASPLRADDNTLCGLPLTYVITC